MSENNGDLGAFLAGFVIGGLVGAATALILAPQSGQETRSQLGSQSESLRHASGERLQQYRQTAEGSLAGSRERVQEVGGQMQERARIVLDTGREQVAKVRQQGGDQDLVEDTTETADEVVAATDSPEAETNTSDEGDEKETS